MPTQPPCSPPRTGSTAASASGRPAVPGVLHNTVASTQAPFTSIEWRFSNAEASVVNNLVTHTLRERDGASALQQNNLSGQPLTLFAGNGVDGDLHLETSAAIAINKVTTPVDAPDDIDGDQIVRPKPRPTSGPTSSSLLTVTPLLG